VEAAAGWLAGCPLAGCRWLAAAADAPPL